MMRCESTSLRAPSSKLEVCKFDPHAGKPRHSPQHRELDPTQHPPLTQWNSSSATQGQALAVTQSMILLARLHSMIIEHMSWFAKLNPLRREAVTAPDPVIAKSESELPGTATATTR